MSADQTPGASLELADLAKHYDDAVAVESVSLSIAAGEFVTLLGPSGSGKTTTLNMIAGFASVTEGTIVMDGRPIEQLSAHRRDIGMVFQHYALFPHMSVRQNVAFPLKRRKVPKGEIETRVKEALELVDLGNLGERYPEQLSGGQQQRVALARAIVFRPRVLLMDEPLGSLDKKLREDLQLEIKRIHRDLGITFVYVTHDQEEALVLSDRIAVFNKGRIEQVGPPEDLYERPATTYVAAFLGESNIFTGRSSAEGLVTEDGIHLRTSQATPTGGNTAIVVRPERMQLALGGRAPGDSDNVLSGTVRSIIYLGLARKVEVELPGGRTVVLREPAGRACEANEGDGVELYWSPDDAVVISDPADAPGIELSAMAEPDFHQVTGG